MQTERAVNEHAPEHSVRVRIADVPSLLRFALHVSRVVSKLKGKLNVYEGDDAPSRNIGMPPRGATLAPRPMQPPQPMMPQQQQQHPAMPAPPAAATLHMRPAPSGVRPPAMMGSGGGSRSIATFDGDESSVSLGGGGRGGPAGDPQRYAMQQQHYPAPQGGVRPPFNTHAPAAGAGGYPQAKRDT